MTVLRRVCDHRAGGRYRSGAYVLDTACRELSRSREVVSLEPKAYQVLVYLVAHRHRVVTRAERLEHVLCGVRTILHNTMTGLHNTMTGRNNQCSDTACDEA